MNETSKRDVYPSRRFADHPAGGARRRRWRRAYQPYDDRVYYRDEPAYRVESYRYEREPAFEDEPIRLVRPRRDYHAPAEPAERWDRERAAIEDTFTDEPLGVSLPVHMI